MEFNEFVHKVEKGILRYLTDFDIEKINVEKITKNNGVQYTGIVIVLRGENIAPTIYIDYYYMLYRQGTTLDVVLGYIREEYISARKALSKNDLSTDFDELDSKVFAKLINFKKNKKYLGECPYIPYLDMAISFRYLVRKDEHGIASAAITNKEMKKWGLTTDELYDMAKKNTMKVFPPIIKRMDELLQGLCDEGVKVDGVKQLFVLSNEIGINGATGIIFHNVIRDFARSHKRNVFILPSSIHEVILLLESEGMSQKELSEMVTEINRYAVSEQDFLSDRVYLYDLEKDILTT